jgi:hypothetical protein
VLQVCHGVERGTTNGRMIVHDCADDGLDCFADPMGAGCGHAGSCTAFGLECVGDSVRLCMSSGPYLEYDCTEVALDGAATCGDADPDHAGLDPGCVPTGGACTPGTDAPHCTGLAGFECHPDHARWFQAIDCTDPSGRLDCAAGPTHVECQPDFTGVTCETPAETTVCDCDDMLVCNPLAGTDMRFACPDLALDTCGDVDPDPVDTEYACM